MGATMNIFHLAQLIADRKRSDRLYLEFLRVPSCSLGLYELPAGAADPQQPHTEDEAYYVVRGRGFIRIGTEDQAVEAGTVVFVPAGVVHRFHSITEDLTLLVFFAPAEGSQTATVRS
jgi:mannose-6-phosphate isomerase-like protein (cupin superfamily)